MSEGTDRRPRPKPTKRPTVDFLEDDTLMNNASSEPTPRGRNEQPSIAEVGFNKRMSPDREETPVSSLVEPWEEIVDSTSRPLTKRSKPTAPTQPVSERKVDRPAPKATSLPPRKTQPKASALPSRHDDLLDYDTDEGVVSVPPDPDAFAPTLQPLKKHAKPELPPPPKRVPIAPSALPAFGIDGESWPSGATKPVQQSPLKRTPERKKADLLENKPVTGAKKPPARPNPEETRHGPLVESGRSARGGETIAAPGELAGILDSLPRSPARPELVDDLMSPAAMRNSEREQRRAEMRKSVETTSPDELRRMRRSTVPPQPPPRDPEDTGDLSPPPPNRMEETRALVDNPLTRPPTSHPPVYAGAVSEILPLPPIEEPEDIRPYGETQVILRLAPGMRRIAALAIDALLMVAIVMVPGLLGLFGESFSTANWLDPDDVSLLLIRGDLTFPLIAMVLVTVIFSAVSHGVAGRSLGKLILGLELVRKKTGERVGFARAIVRAFVMLLSLFFGGAGYLWLIVDRRARTLHDYLTGTVVVVSASRAEGSRAQPGLVQHEPTI